MSMLIYHIDVELEVNQLSTLKRGVLRCMGLTENDGRENDGLSQWQCTNLEDMKMTDQK